MAGTENPFYHYVLDLEEEAELFLKKYECADAIETPRPIPIRDIATRLMSLEIIETEYLSSDESVQGAIAFSPGIVDVYDWSQRKYIGYEVRFPSLFVDADITNEGRINNTIAHECYHWWRHRNYFNYERIHKQRTEFGIRCERNMPKQHTDKKKYSDVENMEWQARTIAPLILMPSKATAKKIDELYLELASEGNQQQRQYVTPEVIRRLALYYNVSKQMATIRMAKLGYKEAEEYTGYDESEGTQKRLRKRSTHAKSHQQPIDLLTAFRLYFENEFLRTTIDTGAFCFADGYFVLKNEKYISDVDGIHLTEYAKNHLAECTLDFSTSLVGEATRTSSGETQMMFRSDTVFKKEKSFDSNTQNTEMFNKAVEFEKQFKHSREHHQTANERLLAYMDEKKWQKYHFMQYTHLDEMHYSRIKKPDYKFKKPALISIGVGLGLYLTDMEEILDLAGQSFSPTDICDQAYKYLFTAFQGKDIDECNEFLKQINESNENAKIPLLGTKQQKH